MHEELKATDAPVIHSFLLNSIVNPTGSGTGRSYLPCLLSSFSVPMRKGVVGETDAGSLKVRVPEGEGSG